jgi:hypothetical protein
MRGCFDKCMRTSADKEYIDGGDIKKGEGVCVDRCMTKYLAVFEKISTRLNQQQQQQQ